MPVLSLPLSVSSRTLPYLLAALSVPVMACSSPEDLGDVTQPLCNNETSPCPCPGSPIIIDIAGDGIALTSWRDGVKFGLRPGTTGIVSWTSANSDDAWLVMDRNRNGIIDDGSEMFGNFTPQPALRQGEEKNGFRALVPLDANRDGRIDKLDPEFDRLRLWQDIDHDGLSAPDELSALPVLGVEGLSVEYSPSSVVDRHGNRFAYSAPVYPAAGRSVGMTAWDVWLTGTRPVFTSETSSAVGTTSAHACDGADPLPDLKPSMVAGPPPSVRLNDCFGFNWRVRNIGSGAGGAYRWAVYLNGERRTDGSGAGLAAGASDDFGAVLCPPYIPYNINVVAVHVNTQDPPPPNLPAGRGTLLETSYSNNFVTAPFAAAD